MKTLSSLILPATLEHLSAFISAVTEVAESNGVSPKKIYDIELALEEALVNIINYAYKKEKGDIEVTCRSENGDWFVMKIIDRGMPFDVLSVPTPDITADIADRNVGGLGIYFVKKVMDHVEYRREGEKNILEMKLRIKQETI